MRNPEKAFEQAREVTRLSVSLPAAAAALLLDAVVLEGYLRHVGFQSWVVAAPWAGTLELTRPLLMNAFVWFSLLRIFIYPVMFHAAAAVQGGETGIAVGLDAHARATAVLVAFHAVGSVAAIVWPISLVWQLSAVAWGAWTAFILAWAVRLDMQLARAVYGLDGAKGALTIALAVALTGLLLASILVSPAVIPVP